MHQSSRHLEKQTILFKKTSSGEERIGYLGSDGTIYRLRWDEGYPVGRVEGEAPALGDRNHRIFRITAHGERELGSVSRDGIVRSHGLFEGGELGWVDPDGTVIQAGLILGEEEVGRVEGPQLGPAAAALLLLFLPDDAEASRDMQKGI